MINNVTRQLFSRAGIFAGRTTQPKALQALVREMRVIPTGHPLLRLGPAGDGGYLVPDVLDGLTACFSPGVADCADFELALAEHDIPVFLADRSVDKPPINDPRLHFLRKFLASTTSEEDGLITLQDWMQDCATRHGLNESGDMLLQMDIEGAEYEVLHNISTPTLERFRVVVIEFHKLYQLADRYSFRWMSGAIRKLLRNHAVVHMHPNNNRKTLKIGAVELPANLEVTLLRRDYLNPIESDLSFPHPLDEPCVPHKPELVLPACWYR